MNLVKIYRTRKTEKILYNIILLLFYSKVNIIFSILIYMSHNICILFRFLLFFFFLDFFISFNFLKTYPGLEYV